MVIIHADRKRTSSVRKITVSFFCRDDVGRLGDLGWSGLLIIISAVDQTHKILYVPTCDLIIGLINFLIW